MLGLNNADSRYVMGKVSSKLSTEDHKKKKLSSEDLKELEKTTKFSSKELNRWYRQYRKEYPTGFLTLHELKKLYESFFPDGEADRFVVHAFRTFDTDRNNRVDFRELMRALSVTCRGSFDDQLRWMFSMYDINADGVITREEMLEIIEAEYKMAGCTTRQHLKEEDSTPERRVEEIFERIDVNKDGFITMEELLTNAKDDETLRTLLGACNQLSETSHMM